jgi:hypothetical protein
MISTGSKWKSDVCLAQSAACNLQDCFKTVLTDLFISICNFLLANFLQILLEISQIQQNFLSVGNKQPLDEPRFTIPLT